MNNKCSLCHRDSKSSEYCMYHSSAYNNLKAAYKSWKDAIGLNWGEYLNEISKKQETGLWAKEVALNELNKM